MRGVSIVEEARHRMPGAVFKWGVPLEGETLSDFPIGPTIVSGLREAPSVSVWVPPRVPRWLLDVLFYSSGGCGLAGARRLSGGWLCCWSWVVQDTMVRGGLQQCPQMPDLLRVNHSLPYEWRPLWPSVKGFTPESGPCL